MRREAAEEDRHVQSLWGPRSQLQILQETDELIVWMTQQIELSDKMVGENVEENEKRMRETSLLMEITQEASEEEEMSKKTMGVTVPNCIAKTNRIDVSGHWTIVVSVDSNVVGAGHPLQSRLHRKQPQQIKNSQSGRFQSGIFCVTRLVGKLTFS